MAEVSAEAPSALELQLAMTTGDILERAYPGHGWRVYARSGVVYFDSISVCMRRQNAGWRMVIHQDDMHDARRVRDKVVRAGGEYLERCGIRRGIWHGDEAVVLEK